VKIGRCFFTPDSVPGGRHLWIVVSDPAQSTHVAIVSFSTKPDRNSDACMVPAGSHRHLPEDSFVRCERARVEVHAALDKKLATRHLSETFDASDALVRTVQDILLACPLTVRGIQKLIADQRQTSRNP
jgi:hypothetical protein